MAQQQQQEHPIFGDILRGDFAAVQQRVLADAAVLDERERYDRRTPLIHAIWKRQPAIALWLLEHRGQHDVNTADALGQTTLHWASSDGPLAVVQALVAAGANPAALTELGYTPLICASYHGHIDIVAFLLQLPAVKASIDHISQEPDTALSYASLYGRQPIVQLLLDAGADPTIPAGQRSPLNQALSNNHHAVTALLRHVIVMAGRARALHKLRSLLGAGTASLACLQGRVEQGEAPPRVELITFERHQQMLQHLQQHLLQQQQQLQHVLQEHHEHQHLLQVQQLHQDLELLLQRRQQQQEEDEKLRAMAAFAVGVSGGEKDTGCARICTWSCWGTWCRRGRPRGRGRTITLMSRRRRTRGRRTMTLMSLRRRIRIGGIGTGRGVEWDGDNETQEGEGRG